VSPDRTCERAAFVSEQLAFRQVGGDRTAVEHDERPAGARALVVQSVGEQVLAAAGFPEERDGDFGPCDPFDDVEDLVHRGRTSSELSESANAVQTARRDLVA
jgi:hypothetical protein